MTPEPTRDVPSAASSAAAATASAPSVRAGDDATQTLFHMSRTAGVGLGDYAAVNVRAVIGLMLGVASVLAYIFADSYLPLAIPLAAVIVSIVALVQIRASNGTQTGRGLAIGGVVLAVLLGGMTIAKQVRGASAESVASAELRSLVKKYSDATNAHDAKTAYALFTRSFQTQVVYDSFERTLVSRAANLFGPNQPIEHCEMGPRVNFESGPSGALASASTLMVIYGTNTNPDGTRVNASIPIDFALEDGHWKIQDVRDYYIQQQRAR